MSACILWAGALDRDGYGRTHDQGAHRVAFANAGGVIPPGYEVDHLCRNRACVNPDHLEAVTHAENIRRAHAARTACVHGHPYTEENTYRTARGTRRCRTCQRQWKRTAAAAGLAAAAMGRGRNSRFGEQQGLVHDSENEDEQ